MKPLISMGIIAGMVWGTTFTSPQIKPNSPIPKGQVYYSCGGDNISPMFQWDKLPKKVKFVSVVVWDPDAPKPGGWYHWLLLNIPAKRKGIPLGAGNPTNPFFNIGKELKNDFGELGYGGPCPPPGKPHRYLFKLYLQKEAITPPKNGKPADVEKIIKEKSIGVVSIVGIYGRK